MVEALGHSLLKTHATQSVWPRQTSLHITCQQPSPSRHLSSNRETPPPHPEPAGREELKASSSAWPISPGQTRRSRRRPPVRLAPVTYMIIITDINVTTVCAQRESRGHGEKLAVREIIACPAPFPAEVVPREGMCNGLAVYQRWRGCQGRREWHPPDGDQASSPARRQTSDDDPARSVTPGQWEQRMSIRTNSCRVTPTRGGPMGCGPPQRRHGTRREPISRRHRRRTHSVGGGQSVC